MTAGARRLLVVDDLPEFGRFVESVAVELGFEVRVVTSGGEFRAAFDAFQPTHMTLDLIMPDMDGIEVLRALGNVDRPLSLVVISGYNPQYMRSASRLGELQGARVVATLRKPVSLAALRRALSDDERPA